MALYCDGTVFTPAGMTKPLTGELAELAATAVSPPQPVSVIMLVAKIKMILFIRLLHVDLMLIIA